MESPRQEEGEVCVCVCVCVCVFLGGEGEVGWKEWREIACQQ